ncbi:MAG: discoidin domain-containing protein, partial [Chitinophagales bacterium]
SKIEIYNRTDCCSERINGATVYVKQNANNQGTAISTLQYQKGMAKMTVNPTQKAIGRYIRIAKSSKGYLSMAEVKIYGTPAQNTPIAKPTPTSSAKNLAQGKPTRQSSTMDIGKSSLAVDGNTNGVWTGRSVSHTNEQNNPWWEVDLGAMYDISKVEIYNRTDCCSERIGGAITYVKQTANEKGAALSIIDYQKGMSPIIKVKPGKSVRGRYVRIAKKTGYLSLAEVKVYGNPIN